MKRHDAKKTDHAYSRYSCITYSVIDLLQKEHLAGRDPGKLLDHIDAKEASVIVSESLEADQLIKNITDALSSGRSFTPPSDGYSDWSLASAAELFLLLADEMWNLGNTEQHKQWWSTSWATLEKVAQSPTASPMLSYEDIYIDISEEMAASKEIKALEYLKRGLVYDLTNHEGVNAIQFLRDIADLYLNTGKYDKGVAILAALLHNDPSDIWTYNQIAVSFSKFGMVQSGIKATRRALELVHATGDPEQLTDQLNWALKSYDQPTKSKEHRVNKKIHAGLNAALELDFSAGRHVPVAKLCDRLVPNLDRTPVKKKLY
ncbi:MAG: hypothetical protein JXA42_21195 [Anaerolineales bacterium]|nr:hypothetical protein [Anaerolineales bacterium]